MDNFQFKYPELYQFFGGYFYQGWVADYRWENESPNFTAVVRHFKAINPPTTIAKVRNELEDLLRLELNEENLKQVLQNLGSNFYPKAENLTINEWLERVLEILNESTAKSRILRELH